MGKCEVRRRSPEQMLLFPHDRAYSRIKVNPEKKERLKLAEPKVHTHGCVHENTAQAETPQENTAYRANQGCSPPTQKEEGKSRHLKCLTACNSLKKKPKINKQIS